MAGFGSDSYSGSGAYQGGSSIYNPPGGNSYQTIGDGGSESFKSSITSQPKWGASTTSATKGSSGEKKQARKQSSSSSSSSEDEAAK